MSEMSEHEALYQLLREEHNYILAAIRGLADNISHLLERVKKLEEGDLGLMYEGKMKGLEKLDGLTDYEWVYSFPKRR